MTNTNKLALTKCNTWEEMLEELLSYSDKDPIVLQALKELGEYTGKRFIYYSMPAYVRYEGELVEGWSYSLYVDGTCIASIKEC